MSFFLGAKCISTKDSDKFNIYAAMHGYNTYFANPYDDEGDPAVRSRIFLHDCSTNIETDSKDGYFDFIGDVRTDMHCDSDFSLKSITSAEEYNEERSSSNDFNLAASASAGTCINLCYT